MIRVVLPTHLRKLARVDGEVKLHVKGTVTGTTFTASIIEVQNTQTGLPVNANGLVESLTGSELAFQFVIGSRTIRGDHLTTFFGSGNRLHSFTNLANGVRAMWRRWPWIDSTRAPLYDFVLGLNRWSYRVLVYTALMRDEYPPFRLEP